MSDSNSLPTLDEFVKRLSDSLAYLEQIDSSCSFSFELARWQEWVSTWTKVLDDSGGI